VVYSHISDVLIGALNYISCCY